MAQVIYSEYLQKMPSALDRPQRTQVLQSLQVRQVSQQM
jgi:hypothetical protein